MIQDASNLIKSQLETNSAPCSGNVTSEMLSPVIEKDSSQFSDMKTKQLAELSDQLKRINSRSEIVDVNHQVHEQLNDAKKDLKLPLENSLSTASIPIASQVSYIQN